MSTFSRNFHHHWKCREQKENFQTILVIIFLELYNILVQIRFITSKTKLDIQQSKLGIRVASRAAERLKTQDLRKLGNIRKISNLSGYIAQCLVSLQKLRLCQQQLKNTQKHIPNVSFPVKSYWITPFCSKYFVRDCRYQILEVPNFSLN